MMNTKQCGCHAGIEAAFRAPRQAQTFVFCHSTSSHKIPHEVGVMHTFMHMCEHSITQGLVFFNSKHLKALALQTQRVGN